MIEKIKTLARGVVVFISPLPTKKQYILSVASFAGFGMLFGIISDVVQALLGG